MEKTSALLGPGIVMLILAIILDIIGVICFVLNIFFVIGEIPSLISDIIGMIFIGGWMFFRSGKVGIPERAKKRPENLIRKLFRGKYKKFLTPVVGEVAPFVGALPFWTLSVYFELTS